MARRIASVPLTTLAALLATLVMGAVPAWAEIFVFTAQLRAANEVAPVVVHPTETGVTGSATVTLDVTRTGGVITAATSKFDVSLTGFPPGSVIILAHIHQGGPAVNGPIRVDSGISPGTPVPTPGGSANFTRDNLATSPVIAQAMIDDPGGFYFNVHTALSPSGVARGQLQLVGQAGVPTLTPGGVVLMTLLLMATATFFLRRRRASSAPNA